MVKLGSWRWVWLALGLTVSAWAHFQVIWTPRTALALEDASQIVLKLVFTHPFEGNFVMPMGEDMQKQTHPPKAFGVMTRQGAEGPLVMTDLLGELKAVAFASPTNKGLGYELDYRLKGMGDFVFYLDPAPYWEPAEDTWIRHVTKVIVNRGGVPSCWDAPVGDPLPCEIVPLVQPYALWTGNVFRGVVTKGGKPVPFAEIEVEYLNHPIEGNALGKKAAVEAPQDAFVTQIIKADANGSFTYGLARAGWWGFAALGLTDEKYQGKPVELGALIWVQAVDMGGSSEF